MKARELEDQPLLTEGRPKSHAPYVPFILLLNAGICGAFYGWNAIAETYISGFLGFSVATTDALVSIAFFVNYSFALLGGFIADAYIGNFRLLVMGTAGIVAATLVLLNTALLKPYYPEHLHVPFTLVGIGLFVLGNGISKPGLSAFMGAQFNENESKLRSEWFSWFYLSIQIGALGFSLGTPFALQYLPPWITFVIILIPALFGFVIFLIPSGSYRKVVPGTNVFATFFGIIFFAMFNKRGVEDRHWLDKAKRRYPHNEVEDVRKALRVLMVFIPLPFFWAVFFQMYSIWVSQAKLMDLRFGKFSLPPGTTTVLNGVIDIFLIPLFEKAIYPLCGMLFNFTPLKRIAVGHIFTIAALIAAGVVSLWISQSEEKLSIFWILPQYFLISCGEILLSITGLEFAFAEAPASMKGMMTAIFMSTTAVGNGMIAILALMDFELYLKDFALAGIIFVVLIVFSVIAYFYEKQKAAEAAAIN